MKINDVIVEKQQIDELTAGEVGQAVGKGVKAVGTGISNFAKGFKAGWQGKGVEPAAASAAAPSGAKKPMGSTPTNNDPLGNIKDALSKLSPKQRAALRKQIAQKAGVQ